MVRMLLSAGLALAISGCQTAVPVLVDLRGLTVADLRAAQMDADRHADRIASGCYQALLSELQIPDERPVGALSALQKARNAHRFIQSEAFAMACGPLAVDWIRK